MASGGLGIYPKLFLRPIPELAWKNATFGPIYSDRGIFLIGLASHIQSATNRPICLGPFSHESFRYHSDFLIHTLGYVCLTSGAVNGSEKLSALIGSPSQFENQSKKFFLRQTLEKKFFLVLGQIFRVKQVSSSKKMDLTLNLRPTGELQIWLSQYYPILEIALAGE